MKTKSVKIPEDDYMKLEKLVQEQKFPNTSEAIRFAIKMLVREK